MDVTSRCTRLVRAADLRAFRKTIGDLATQGSPLEACDRLIVVPTRAAAAHLRQRIEAGLARATAVVLPDVIIPRDLGARFAARVSFAPPLSAPEREILLFDACRAAGASGVEPPFRVRPALVAEMLRFYDTLRRNLRDVDTFERLALGRLEPGAAIDRGAERLVRQTRFLVAAFRLFEARAGAAGEDEHVQRGRVLAETAARPIRHVVVAAGDRAFERHGLYAADWDLLARVPGLRQLDVVVTDTTLAGALHERMHALLPGIEEIRVSCGDAAPPVLVTAAGGSHAHVSRDREEEVAGFVRRVKGAARRGELDPARAALVVAQPLPYVYLARELFRSAGVPCQMVDALPLAAEPYAAAVDVVCTAVSSAFARAPGVELLRSPHFRFMADRSDAPCVSSPADAQAAATSDDVRALDRALHEAGYLGGIDGLERLLERWGGTPDATPAAGAWRAGVVLLALARELEPLQSDAPAAEHLARLSAFLERHARTGDDDDPTDGRESRARHAVLRIVGTLGDAYARFDPAPVGFDTVVALLRRWIEGHTFAPRTGDRGVHVVDADSARFGEFDLVQLAGLVDGEWPDRPRRSIFYAPEILRELGWPSDADRRDAIRARFVELLRLPLGRVTVSSFLLEADAPVSPSTLLDELQDADLEIREDDEPSCRIFAHEALALDPMAVNHLEPGVRRWALHRGARPGNAGGRRPRGFTGPHAAPVWSLSALERYQDCPFKFFARDVLRLEEEPDDGASFSPRARGRLVHQVLQRFFEVWDAQDGGPITPARLEKARAAFVAAAEPLLDGLPHTDAALERARLFGTAVSMGVMDVILGGEVARPEPVRERWLEHRLDGRFALGGADGCARVALRGIADRIDLLPGRRLRVLDYKTGLAPDPARVLQVPVYALCAKERLEERDGKPWEVEEAAYVPLSGVRPLVAVVSPGGAGAREALEAARGRLEQALEAIGRGAFPPRPADAALCGRCAFVSVCRKEYVERV